MSVSEGETILWAAGGRSVVGAAHVRHGIPNQDAIAISPAEGRAPSGIVALADGHGAAMHFRSAIGAHMAVDAALRVLGAAAADAAVSSARLAAPTEIARAIIADWRAQVSEHVAANPFGASEALHGRDPFIPYGTTLIAAAATRDGVFVLQLGDGDLMLGSPDGELWRPLPDDVGLVGEQTYSLCQPDAASHTRARWLAADEAPVDFAMLSTDGLSKSFVPHRAFVDATRQWRARIALEGLPRALEKLGPWLSETSKDGSGDDITVGFLLAPDGLGGGEARAGDRNRRTGEESSPPHPGDGAHLPRLRVSARRVATALLSALAVAVIAAAAYVFVAS
jgi:hypothetical protein